MAPQHPEWKTKQPFKAVLDHDIKALAASGEKGLLEIIAATHTGMTVDHFSKIVLRVDDNRAPSALQAALYRDSSTSRCSSYWDTFVPMASRPSSCPAAASSSCARGPRRFMAFRRSRSSALPVSQNSRSSPTDALRCSSCRRSSLSMTVRASRSGINRFIGGHPIFAFGNSDGDLQMLQWTAAWHGRPFYGHRPSHRRRA